MVFSYLSNVKKLLFIFGGVLLLVGSYFAGEYCCQCCGKKKGKLTLYYSAGASSLADRIVINELKIDADFVSVNLKNKKTEQDEDYYKINSLGYVPAMRFEDGSVLTENVAIMTYLAEKYGCGKLLGKGFDKYRTLEKMSFIASELHKNIGAFFAPMSKLEYKFQMEKLEKKLQYVDNLLGKQKYFTGNDYTIADVYGFVILNTASIVAIDLSKYQNIIRFMQEISNREAVLKSLKEEGFIK